MSAVEAFNMVLTIYGVLLLLGTSGALLIVYVSK